MHELIAPTFSPRVRRLGGLALLAGAALAALMLLRRAPIAPPVMTVLPVTVPAPLVVIPPAPPPPPPPPPVIEEPPAPRASAPSLDATCIATRSTEGVCGWDRGFPAISADGRMVVSEDSIDDGARGNEGLAITFIDTRTSKVVRSVILFDVGEFVPTDDPTWPALQAKIASHVTTAQHLIDAGNFRTMVVLSPDRATAGLRVELVDDAVRVIDVPASTVLWQARFAVEADAGKVSDANESSCHLSSSRVQSVAWDPGTRSLLTTVAYVSSPCYCSNEVRQFVHRLR